MKHKIIFFGSVVFLSGCMLQPVKSQANTTYLLSSPTSTVAQLVPVRSTKNLLVSVPTAPKWLSTNQMVYQLSSSRLNYFAQHQWAATPTEMLEPIIAEALSTSGRYHAVVQAPFGGNVDERLDVRILNMEQDFTQTPSVYRFSVQAQLINQISGNIIRTRYFNYVIPVPSNNPEGGVAAANKAIAEWIPQLIDFCRRSPANT